MSVARRRATSLAGALLLALTTLAAVAPTAQAGGLTWTAPVNPDPYRGDLTAISCVHPTWCMAVDRSGQAVRYVRGHWRRPVRVESVGLFGGLTDVSCASTLSCVAVDQRGAITRFDGRSWSTPTLPAGWHVRHIACPTGTFCMALAKHRILRIDGATGRPLRHLPASADVSAISCSSARFCAATTSVLGDGNFVQLYRNGTWSKPQRLDHRVGKSFVDVSCTSHLFCMAIGEGAIAERYDGAHWLDVTRRGLGGFQPASVSCASFDYCLAVGGQFGHARSMLWDGQTWSALSTFLTAATAKDVSCARQRHTCQAVAGLGYVARNVLGTWGKAVVRDPSRGFLTAVSCGAPHRCAAVDASGYLITTTGHSWTKPVRIDSNADLAGSGLYLLSCTSTIFCLTVDTARFARVMRSDGTWHEAATPPVGAGALSCVSRTWCALMDDGGRVSIFDGTSWSAPTKGFPDNATPAAVWTLSCWRPWFCVAEGSTGVTSALREFDGKAWSGATLAGDGQSQGVSCSSDVFCMAIIGTARAARWDGGAWHVLRFPEPVASGVSCISRSFCVAGGGAGDFATWNGTTWVPGQVLPLADNQGWSDVSCASRTLCVGITPVQTTFGRG